MFATLLKSLSRHAWIPLTCAVLPLSYGPLLGFENFAAGILLPLAVTTVCVMFALRHRNRTILVVLASIAFTFIAMAISNLTWAPNSDARILTFASLGLTQLSLGLAWWCVSQSRSGFEPTQRRLASRIQRQAQQLRVAKESAESATTLQFESNRRALLEHLPVHIVQKGLDGRFTFVTQSFCNLVHRNYDEIIGCTDADLFPPEASQKFMEDDQRVMQQGIVFDDVEQTQLPDGTHSYMQVRKAPLRAADGAIAGVQGIFWDVTEEHSGRQELKRIEALAHALIHATLDAVLIVDPDGCVLEANPASESILGYTRDQVAAHPPIGNIMQTALGEIGQRASDSKESKDYFDRKVPIAKVLESATGKRIEARLMRSDGIWFDAEVSAHPLSIEGSEGWAMFVRDITRRKRNETELRSAKELAERANAAKSEFVANVSHELRTPLTGIIGLHELLQRSEIDARQQNYLQLAQVSSSNLLNLIDDLLDFSKIEAGRIDIESVPFSLIDCVEEAAASIAARAQLRGLELMVELEPSLPVEMLGDPHRIKQILLNLLGNAIKFTEKGDITVQVRPVGSPAAVNHEQRVRFEVHDNGIGVPIEQREFIFDAFRQADSSTTRRYGGTGLGLTICRDLVAMMNGHIGITDADHPGGNPETPGSCFFFELPLTVLQLAPTNWAIENPNREHIVLVASMSPWRTLLEQQIRQFGFEVTLLSGDQLAARQPAQLFDAGNNTIVVADFRELNSQHLPTTPVVVRWLLLTPLANSQPATTPSWLKYADVRWITRPVRRTELRRALAEESPPISNPATAPESEACAADILLVEDSPVSQTVLKDMLESMGHRVHLAGNGKEAITACASQQFDLVLMDIQMPEVDGLAATQAIREREEYGQNQLILALTAHASAEDRTLCESAGMNGFLVKPITLDALQQAIASATAVPNPEDRQFVAPVLEPHDASDNTNLITPIASALDMQNQDSNSPSDDSPPADQTTGAAVETLSDAPDWTKLVALMNGSESLLRDVLQLIVREIPKLGRNFSEAVAKKDLKEARRAVHTLKSNVRHVGLNQVSEFAEALERHARDEKLELLEDATEQVSRVAAAVADWAEQMVKQH